MAQILCIKCTESSWSASCVSSYLFVTTLNVTFLLFAANESVSLYVLLTRSAISVVVLHEQN